MVSVEGLRVIERGVPPNLQHINPRVASIWSATRGLRVIERGVVPNLQHIEPLELQAYVSDVGPSGIEHGTAFCGTSTFGVGDGG